MNRILAVFVGLMSLGLLAPAAGAADLSGYVSGNAKVVETLPLSGDRVAKRVRFNLAIVTDEKTNPFNLASQDCMATYVYAKDGKVLDGHGYCDGITAGGDIWWISLHVQPDGKVAWTNVGGTGALAGVTASGTSRTLAQFDDGKVIIRFEGTRSK
jgi:hypothetical protein